METTIQVSRELLERLRQMKTHDKESYEDLIWDLIEDRMELSQETKENIVQSEKEIKEGKTVSFEDIKKKYNLKCTQ
jgi:predicted transcriptional regulator